MPYYAKGDRVRFTGGVIAELIGIGGIVAKRRIVDGHYVYDVKLSIEPKLAGLGISGLKITLHGTFYIDVPSDWIELDDE